jgi:hypothetical protein
LFGAESDIDNTDVNGILLWYDVDTGDTDGTQLNYSFELYFLDVLNPDNSNLKDVLSDTLQVATDICAKIYNYDGDIEFDMPKKARLNPVSHKYTSDYAGHSATFTINAPYEWNECFVPSKVAPSFGDQFFLLIDDTNYFLIDDTNKLII